MARPFRPKRKVTDPWGKEWQLFVSRFALPEWKEGEYNGWIDSGPSSRFDGPLFLLELPVALIDFLWSSILLPLLRILFLMPFAVVKGRRSQAARIEAICFFPSRETRTWTTTLDQVDSVVNQIALGIEEGKVVQPIGAVYSGSHTD
jgi:hypothetical protein